MKKSLLILLSLLLLGACQTADLRENSLNTRDNEHASTVSVEEATRLASTVLQGKQLTLTPASVEQPAYYIFNAEEGGFVIVSAYEVAEPILGYSDTEHVDDSNLPLGLQDILGSYTHEITEARKMGVTPTRSQLSRRDALLRGNQTESPKMIVAPLLGDIMWNQGRGYDSFTPAFTPVGCVATAAAMIMRYWEYPSRGYGVHQYRSDRFGMQGHNYNYTLQWSQMPLNSEEYGKLRDDEKSEANFHISRFCYGVAVALNMNFDYGENGGSGTFQNLVPNVLRKFYKYPPTVRNLYKEDYTAEEWETMLRAELNAKRPVQYAGRGEGGGHSFVIDGYNDKGFYSLNWGWGGSSNGWFKLSALSPEVLGEGGGTGGFNMDHEMIIGFEPPARITGDNVGEVDELDPPLFNKPVVLPSLDLFIKYTKFNGVETFSTAGGYEDYSDKVIVVDGGKLETVITPYFLRPDAKGYLLLSIDLNHNGVFNAEDDGDLIVSLNELSSGESINKVIDLMSFKEKPEMGERYRMRVNISAYGYSNPNYMISGEVEDYTIIIK